MKFGRYYIGQDFSEISENADEVSKANKAVHLKEHEDEIEYHVNNANFCHAEWGTCVNVSRGQVFSISMQTTDRYLIYPMTGEIFYDILFKYLNEKLSKIVDQNQEGSISLSVWDAPWGNVVLIKSLVKGSKDGLQEYNLAVRGGPPSDKVDKGVKDLFMDLLIGLNDFSAS